MHTLHTGTSGRTGPAPLVHLPHARRLMAEFGVDAVVAMSSKHVLMLAGYGTWLDANVRSWMFDPTSPDTVRAGFAVLTRQGETVLGVSPLFEAEAQALSSAQSVVPLPRFRESAIDDVATLAAALDGLGLEGSRVAIEFDGLPAGFQPALSEARPSLRTSDATYLLRLLRTRKAPDMVRRLREVAEDTELALLALRDARTEVAHWQNHARLALANRGADFEHLVYGLPGGGLGQTVGATLPGGFYVDMGAHKNHVVSDTGVTFRSGPADGAFDARYRLAWEALQAGAAALRPGARPEGVHKAMQAVASHAPSMIVQGHGIGFDDRELPLIAAPRQRSWKQADIESDSIINLEVAEFLEDGRSIQIEKSFLITVNGAEPLIAVDRDVPWDYSATTSHI